MTDVATQAEPLSTCGACGQRDDHPKHQVYVGVTTTNHGRAYHEHDFDRNGCIHYHFDCDSEWHDLFSALACEPFESPDPNDPTLAWEESSAMEHRIVATRHAAIVAKAKSGVHGEDLRTWIKDSHAVATAPGGSGVLMMAGGIDQTMANTVLDALGPNSGTKTVGSATITGPQHMRLMTANGSDSAAGTEQGTSAGYTAGGSALAFAAAATGSKATNAAVSWTNMPAMSPCTGMEQWDTSATPLRIYWGPWTGGNITIGSGNTFTVASGNLTDTLS